MTGISELALYISVSILTLLLLSLIGLFLKFPDLFKIGLRSPKRRISQAMTICLGAALGTAVIMASLGIGDAMNAMVDDQVYAALGPIDIAVRSPKPFDMEIFATLDADAALKENTDGMFPLFYSTGAVRTPGGATEGTVNVYGFETTIYAMDAFYKGSQTGPNLGPSECVVNSVLADALGAKEGDLLTLTMSDADPTDAFLSTSVTGTYKLNLTVKLVSENRGLADLGLGSRSTNVNNLFLRLDTLQDTLGQDGKINTIVVSNKGDMRHGRGLDATVMERLRAVVDSGFGYERNGYDLLYEDGQWVLTSKDVIYRADWTTEFARENGLATSKLFTYFVNSISSDRSSVSYSTVTGLDLGSDRQFGEFESSGSTLDLDGLAQDEIMLSNWTADALGVGPGDAVTINYSILDPYMKKVDLSITLKVRAVFDIAGKAAKDWLMPQFPGIKDITSCIDWHPPFDIDLTTISPRDIGYWNEFKGIPKGYVALDLAKSLWGNFQGNITHLRMKAQSGSGSDVPAALNQTLDSAFFGISVDPVKEEQLETKGALWIFTGMFLTFGSMVVIAGALVIINVFVGMAYERKREIGIIRAQGGSDLEVLVPFLTEGIIYSMISAAAGLLLGIALTAGLIAALNSVWSDSIENNTLHLVVDPGTWMISAGVGVLISMASIITASALILKLDVLGTVSSGPQDVKRYSRVYSNVGNVLFLGGIAATLYALFDIKDLRENGVLLLVGPILLLTGRAIYHLRYGKGRKLAYNVMAGLMAAYIIAFCALFPSESSLDSMLIFVIGGAGLVISGMMAFFTNMQGIGRRLSNMGHLPRLGMAGPASRPARSLLTSLSIALVVFLVIAMSFISSYQEQSVDREIEQRSGGYDILGKTSMPVPEDVASQDYGFLGDTSVLQIRSRGDSGGTCSNMNAKYPPQLLGVPGAFIEHNKAEFTDNIWDYEDSREVWRALQENRSYIPIVVDYNTLVWIYNKALGDTFEITGDDGKVYLMRVVGILDASIFAGSFIMSKEHLEEAFPFSSGFSYFLFNTKGDAEKVSQAIELEMADYGMDATVIKDKAAKDLSFELSYLRIFQAFLFLGLLIGSAGVGVLILRSVRERRAEIGMMKALGMSDSDVLKAFLIEATMLTLPAVIIGSLSGIVCALTGFALNSGLGFGVPLLALLGAPAAIFLVAMAFSIIPSLAASRMAPAESLRREI